MPDNTASILLLGCGYTLSKLAAALEPSSYVAVVSRIESYKKLSGISGNLEVCDLRDQTQVIKLFKSYPEINYIVDSTPPDKTEPDLIAQNIAANVSNNPKIKKLIYLSSTGVYNIKDGSWVNENSPTTTDYDKGINRLACEKIYQSLSKSVVCLRISAIYGPLRGLEHNLKLAKKMNLGSLDRWTNRIHVQDLANIIFKLINTELTDKFPKILNCSDDVPLQVADLIKHYAAVLNLDPQHVQTLLVQNNIQGSRESNQRISNKLLKSVLEYKFAYPSLITTQT